jgi:hypothetical protein
MSCAKPCPRVPGERTAQSKARSNSGFLDDNVIGTDMMHPACVILIALARHDLFHKSRIDDITAIHRGMLNAWKMPFQP